MPLTLVRHLPSPRHCVLEVVTTDRGDTAVQCQVGLPGSWRTFRREVNSPAEADTLLGAMAAVRRMQGYLEPTPAIWPTARPAAPRLPGDTVLLARSQPAIFAKLPARQRAYTAWRIGQRRLQAAVPALVEQLERGNALQDYCLAWAIGRCGDAGATEAMLVLAQRSTNDAVRRIAKLAWFTLADDTTRRQHVHDLIGAWPADLRDVWLAADLARVAEVLAAPQTWTAGTLADWAEAALPVCQIFPDLRQSWLQVVASLPLAAGHWRSLRHLYKAAEFLDDAELLGLLHQRIETARANFRGEYVFLQGKYVEVAKEQKKPNSRLAFSERTQDYLRRRTWRHLRRLGLAQDPLFVDLATGVLAACDDTQALPPLVRTSYTWSGQPMVQHFGRYSRWSLYHYLVHRHSAELRTSRSGRSWWSAQPVTGAGREEAFPKLWEARPEALLHLLRNSRCSGVQDFALRILNDLPQLPTTLTPELIGELLQSGHAPTAQFALAAVRRLHAADHAHHWLRWLLASPLPDAGAQALDWISRDPAAYAADSELLVALITARNDLARKTARLLVASATDPAQLVALLLLWLAACDDDLPELSAICEAIQWLRQGPLRSAAQTASHTQLVDLLHHAVPDIVLLAAVWLTDHVQSVATVPAAELTRLLAAEPPLLRSAGVHLFGGLPDGVLLTQPDLVASFACHAEATVRAAIAPALSRLADSAPDFCRALLPRLLDPLFRSDPGDLHPALLALLQGPFSPYSRELDLDTTWRLLIARSRGAQQMGTWRLPDFAVTDFSVRQWARLGNHAELAVRQWVWRAYQDYPELIHAQLADALRLFDASWDDSRHFAAEYFAQLPDALWTPEQLIALCDHLQPEVSQFGRSRLTARYSPVELAHYLQQLGQHPSLAMQQFVADHLESSLAGQDQAIIALEPYFRRVLSLVSAGRPSKNRVLAFLRGEARRSPVVAAWAARLFARQVVTMAVGDHADYVAALAEIQAQYPGLAEPLRIIEPPLRGRKTA